MFVRGTDMSAHFDYEAPKSRSFMCATVGGLSVEEPVYQPEYIETLLRTVRNQETSFATCLLQASKGNAWESLTKSVGRLFGVELLVPQTPGGQIICEYRPGSRTVQNSTLLSAGSGFQQVVLLLASLFTRKGSVLSGGRTRCPSSCFSSGHNFLPNWEKRPQKQKVS